MSDPIQMIRTPSPDSKRSSILPEFTPPDHGDYQIRTPDDKQGASRRRDLSPEDDLTASQASLAMTPPPSGNLTNDRRNKSRDESQSRKIDDGQEPKDRRLIRDSSRGDSGTSRISYNATAPILSPPATAHLKSSSSTHDPVASVLDRLRAGEIPRVEEVPKLSEQQLRDVVAFLIPALGEARVSTAHARLQHSLLAIETDEAAKRAQVEYDATRREVQILQEGLGNPTSAMTDRSLRSPIHSPHSPHALHAFSDYSMQLHNMPDRHGEQQLAVPQLAQRDQMDNRLRQALNVTRRLQDENAILTRRLRKSKKVILNLDGRMADLKEENSMLRLRIWDNRWHLRELQESGIVLQDAPIYAISPSHEHVPSRNTPPSVDSCSTDRQTPTPRGPRVMEYRAAMMRPRLGSEPRSSQDPFDALLQASHVLNSESNNRSSGRAKQGMKTIKTTSHPIRHHSRSAHSMSSLPLTPEPPRNKMVVLRAPHTTMEFRQRSTWADLDRESFQSRLDHPHPSTSFRDVRLDRESTISASDDEEDSADFPRPTQLPLATERRGPHARNRDESPSYQGYYKSLQPRNILSEISEDTSLASSSAPTSNSKPVQTLSASGYKEPLQHVSSIRGHASSPIPSLPSKLDFAAQGPNQKTATKKTKLSHKSPKKERHAPTPRMTSHGHTTGKRAYEDKDQTPHEYDAPESKKIKPDAGWGPELKVDEQQSKLVEKNEKSKQTVPMYESIAFMMNEASRSR